MYDSYPSAMNAAAPVSRGLAFSPAPLRMGAVGAVLGGTAAAAANLKSVQQNDISVEAAIRKTLKTGVNSAFATAAATAAAGMVGRERPWLSLVAMFATGMAVMYLLED